MRDELFFKEFFRIVVRKGNLRGVDGRGFYVQSVQGFIVFILFFEGGIVYINILKSFEKLFLRLLFFIFIYQENIFFLSNIKFCRIYFMKCNRLNILLGVV